MPRNFNIQAYMKKHLRNVGLAEMANRVATQRGFITLWGTHNGRYTSKHIVDKGMVVESTSGRSVTIYNSRTGERIHRVHDPVMEGPNIPAISIMQVDGMTAHYRNNVTQEIIVLQLGDVLELTPEVSYFMNLHWAAEEDIPRDRLQEMLVVRDFRMGHDGILNVLVHLDDECCDDFTCELPLLYPVKAIA